MSLWLDAIFDCKPWFDVVWRIIREKPFQKNSWKNLSRLQAVIKDRHDSLKQREKDAKQREKDAKQREKDRQTIQRLQKIIELKQLDERKEDRKTIERLSTVNGSNQLEKLTAQIPQRKANFAEHDTSSTAQILHRSNKSLRQ